MKILSEHKSAEDLTIEVLQEIVGDRSLEHIRVRLWDGSYWPDDAPRAATLVLNHPGALRAMLHGGSEVAMGEAYLFNDFDIEGNLEAAFEFADIIREQTDGWSKKLKVGYQLGKLPKESRAKNAAERRRAELRGDEHSLERDRQAISFHYDLSNEFYALWLDERKTYSCGYFNGQEDDLDRAQVDKLEHICRKLDLQPGQELLDIGCGWGGLVLHAASEYGVRATGITLSERQAEYARARVRELRLEDRVNIQIADYREVEGSNHFDAIASVGMVEHVGEKNLSAYFEHAYRLLKPGGLFLNHGIGRGTIPVPNAGASFIAEYVFPDGQLLPIAPMLQSSESAGFEIRDVENLREHYALTLDHWVRRLESRHEDALQHVSEPVYRVWRIYMAGSSHGFKRGQLAIYQTLLTKLDKGTGRYPLTRTNWYR